MPVSKLEIIVVYGCCASATSRYLGMQHSSTTLQQCNHMWQDCGIFIYEYMSI